MCGIVGLIERWQDQVGRPELFIDMVESLYHRGPSSGGIVRENGASIGHRRLAVIDLDHGQQPFYSDDQNLILTYNGEIYNYRELSEELSMMGIETTSDTDTEVVLRAYEAWGPHCVQKFRGMFAFGIWNNHDQTLFLARDRFGKKPLYYTITNRGQFIFASELKAIMLHPEVSRELHPQATEDYFAYGYIPDPKTIYKNILKLPPAHTATFTRKEQKLITKRYWDLPMHSDSGENLTEESLVEELNDRFAEAVRLRLRADVPLGAFLSGGVDSSSVVALMQQQSIKRGIHTFSVGFNQRGFDESHFAENTANRYHCNHHNFSFDESASSILHEIGRLYDEPFADSSALPTYLLSQLAKKHVTVILSGDGGDELFLGYRSYRISRNQNRIRSMISPAVRNPLFGFLGKTYPKADWAPRFLRAKRTFQSLATDALTSFVHGNMISPPSERRKLFSQSMNTAIQGYDAREVLDYHYNRAPSDNPLIRMQYIDLMVYLPADILTKVDRASMTHGLEVRVPMLDHHFAEWVWNLSVDWKLKRGNGKYLLKRSMESHVDHSILWRPKMGFSFPLALWLRTILRDRLIKLTNQSCVASCGYFDINYVTTLVKQHIHGSRDHSALLWALLMFDIFLSNNSVSLKHC